MYFDKNDNCINNGLRNHVSFHVKENHPVYTNYNVPRKLRVPS